MREIGFFVKYQNDKMEMAGNMGFEMGKSERAERPSLDRWRADSVLEPNRPLWGLGEIASCLGVSVDTARRWANDPAIDVPVSKPGGRWFAERAQLLAWRRSR